MPGGELILAVAQLLALAALAGGGGKDQLEDLLAHFLDTGLAIEDLAAIDVHVLGHAVVHGRVGGKFQAWRWLAAEAGAASGGEADHVGAAGDLARHRDRIVAWRVHENETALRDRLGIAIDVDHVATAAFGSRAQGLFED